MKKFYLNRNFTKPLDVEISPTLVETLDESLDNMTISLGLTKEKEQPYAPVLNVIGVYEEDEEQNRTLINEFIISADNVELATQNPLRYKHTVSLVQKSQFLTKHLIRNTVFSTDLESLFDYLVSSNTLIADYEDNNILEYKNAGTVINAQYNLSLHKVNEIQIKPSFCMEQRRTTIWEETNFGENHFEDYYCNFINPEKWGDVFSKNSQSGDFPIIRFSISDGGNTYVHDLDFNPNGDNIINGEFLDDKSNEMQDLLDFIQEHNNGLLTISILNLSNSLLINGWDNCTVIDYGHQTPTAHPLGTTTQIMFFNFFIEIYFNATTMSAYDVIETLVKQYRKDTLQYHDATDLFKMPDTSTPKRAALKELLENTSSPNFVFTQASMFDALSEIFRLFDATFRIDEDGYLEIEYFNDRKVEDKFELTSDMKSGRSSSLGEERYANRLVTFFQNTKINDRFPNSNQENAVAHIRSKTLGVPNNEDYVFETPKPINIVKRVRVNAQLKLNDISEQYVNDHAPYYYNYFLHFSSSSFFELLDISDNVIREDLWSILPNTTDIYTINKNNTLTYQEGSNYIEIGKYFNSDTNLKTTILSRAIQSAVYKKYGKDTGDTYIDVIVPNILDAKLAVDYIALVDGKLVNESIDNKYDGEILTNQNNGSIDINKLGLNMVGLSLKLGQPTLTMTQNFTNWNDRIKKGQWFVENGEVWVANTCSYVLVTNEKVQATIEFVKNFNALASRIELNREKRLSNISNDLTVKCEETYGEYIYFTDDPYIDRYYNKYEPIALKTQFIKNSLLMTIGSQSNAQNIDLHYDATSRVINATINGLILSSYNATQLVVVEGYVENPDPQDNNSYGVLTLNENISLSGQKITIPVSTTIKAAIHINDISRKFELNYDILNLAASAFNVHYPSNYIAYKDKLTVALIIDGGVIQGAAILADDQLSSLTGWWDYTDVIIQYPSNTYKIEYSLITALNKDNSIITLNETGEVKNIAIPMVVYGSGNSVCFEMSFESPISAGKRLLQDSKLWNGGWFSSVVLYTNENGEAEKFNIDFVFMQEEITHYFPAMKKSDNNEYLATYSFGALEQFAYYKKPNEIFALNYQLHFLPYKEDGREDCFLSNEFIKNNAFSEGINKRTFHLVYTLKSESNFLYSILDTKGEDDHEVAIDYVGSGITYPNVLDITFGTSLDNDTLRDIGTWALVDEQNNIYFASNNPPGLNGFHLVMFTRHHRLV